MATVNDDDEKRQLLVRIMDEAWSKTGWTDRSLRRSLRGLDEEEGASRPGKGRPSIHETLVHLAYWKHVLARRIAGEEDIPFPEKGRDWFKRPGADARAWNRDARLLRGRHRRLRDAVLEAEDLSDTAVSYVIGTAFHDMYHAGQIELTRKLAARRRR